MTICTRLTAGLLSTVLLCGPAAAAPPSCQAPLSGDAINNLRDVGRNQARVAIACDSRTARNTLVTPGTSAWSQWLGYFVWANALSGGRFQFSQADNYGVVGDRTSQCAVRVPAIIASTAGSIVINVGTNDALFYALYGPQCGTGAASATYFADTIAILQNQIVNPLKAAGFKVFLMLPQQRTTAA